MRASRYWAVVLSAGSSVRMALGRPKQYLPLRGRSLLEWSVAPFLDAGWIDGVVVVLARGDGDFPKLPIARHPKILVVTGGPARADSVQAGLHCITAATQTLKATTFAFVHDAARPCLVVEDLERLRDEASDDNGGLLALPATDAIKRETRERASATIGRSGLWRAQSPQMFRVELLSAALQGARASGTALDDEAAVMEQAGFKPLLVRGRESNLKVVHPEDLPLAEFWLSRQDYAR